MVEVGRGNGGFPAQAGWDILQQNQAIEAVVVVTAIGRR